MEDERKDYLKALSRQCKRETLFCDMDDYTVNLFSSEDTYPSHFHTFEMDGFTVRIENSLLAEALESLDGKNGWLPEFLRFPYRQIQENNIAG